MTNHHALGGQLSTMVGQLNAEAPDMPYEDMTDEQKETARLANIGNAMERLAPVIASSLPAQFSGERMASLVLNQIRKTPRLALCTPQSLVGAVLTCSQLGLEPGDATGEAYLIPRANYNKDLGRKVLEATFTLGYKGMVTLFWRHPLAGYLHMDTVREGDEFDFGYGLDPYLVHKPARKKKNQDTGRGESIGYWYAAAKLTNGGFGFTVLDRSDVQRRRQRSDSPNSPAWTKDYDAMAEKSCMRDLFNEIPKARETQQALAWDGQVRTDLDAAALDDAPPRDYDQQDDAEGDVHLPGGAEERDV